MPLRQNLIQIITLLYGSAERVFQNFNPVCLLVIKALRTMAIKLIFNF